MPDTAPILRFSTDSIPPSQRVERWQDHVGRNLIKLAQIDMEEGDFSAACETTSIEGIDVARITVTDHVVERSLVIRDGDPKDSLFLTLMMQGSGFLHQGRKSVLTAPGDMVLYDPARPYVHGFANDARLATFVLPRDGFELRFGQWTEQSACVLLGRLDQGRRLATKLERNLEASFSALPVQSSTWALIGEIVGALRPFPSVHDSIKHDLVEIRAVCESHIHDRNFSLGTLCAALRMSPRLVQRRFEAAGTSFMLHMREQRLIRAAELLSSPDCAHLTITTVAHDCCFADSAHFSRAFKAKYGETPASWRSRA